MNERVTISLYKMAIGYVRPLMLQLTLEYVVVSFMF